MRSRPILYHPVPFEDLDGWRPVDFEDGEIAIRASVAQFVKLVRDLVRTDAIDISTVDQDPRVVLARHLEAEFLAHGESADSYAIARQRVARHFGAGEAKDKATDAAWARLLNLLTSRADRFCRGFHRENLPVIVFVRYAGAGRDNPAYFQPWVLVRQVREGAFAFPAFELALPLRVSPVYVRLVDRATGPGETSDSTSSHMNEDPQPTRMTATYDHQVEQISSASVSPPHGISSECADVASTPARSESARTRPLKEAENLSDHRMLELLIKVMLESPREAGSPWWGLIGIFGCLVAVFHLTMYFLEANGLVVRGP